MATGGFDAAFLAVGAQLGRRADIPAGDAARMLDAVTLLRAMEGDEPPLPRPACRRLRRRQTRPWTRPGRRGGSAPRTRWSSTGAPAIGCRPTTIEVEEATRRRACGCKWLSTVSERRRRAAHGRADGARRDGLPAADRRVRGARRRRARPRARPGGGPLAARGSRGHRGRATASSRSRPTHDDRVAPGVFAGGDMVPARAHGDRRDRSRQAGGAPHRRAGCAGGEPQAPATPRARRLRPAQHVVLRRRPARRSARELDAARRAARPSTRSSAASTRTTALFEARRCLSCGNCFECDNCFGVCPDNAVHQARPAASATRSTTTTARVVASASQECPCGAIELVDEESGERIAHR